MSNPLLTKNYLAGAAISPFRIVKFSAADTVIPGAAVSDALVGIATDIGPASGELAEVVHFGLYFIEAGAAYAQGARLTTDSVGRGVAAAPAAGTNNSVIGIAVDAAVAAGDIVRVAIFPSQIQG